MPGIAQPEAPPPAAPGAQQPIPQPRTPGMWSSSAPSPARGSLPSSSCSATVPGGPIGLPDLSGDAVDAVGCCWIPTGLRSFSRSSAPPPMWEQDLRAPVLLDFTSPQSQHWSPAVFDSQRGSRPCPRLPWPLPESCSGNELLEIWISAASRESCLGRMGELFGKDIFG